MCLCVCFKVRHRRSRCVLRICSSSLIVRSSTSNCVGHWKKFGFRRDSMPNGNSRDQNSVSRTFLFVRVLVSSTGVRKKWNLIFDEMKRSSGLDLTKNNDTEEEEEKVYFFGDDPDVEHASGDLNRSSQEYSLPKIFITNELERSFSLDVDDRLSKKAIHESLTNVKANEITTSNEFLLPGFCRAGSDSAVNSDRSGKLSEEDYRNIIKLVCNLQSVAKTLSDNYEKLLSNKNNKQLNFRSRDDIINATSTAVDSIKTKRDLRLLVRPEIRKSEEHPTYFRSRSRTDTLSRASSQFFFENERLLDFKANGIGNMRWNDAISVTSPCSTVLESPFDR